MAKTKKKTIRCTTYNRVLREFLEDYATTKKEIKADKGEETIVLNDGEEKMFKQCYDPHDKIRKQIPACYFLSEKYCHLLKVYPTKGKEKITFIKPMICGHPEDGKTRWKVLKQDDGWKSGIRIYALYAIVFGEYPTNMSTLAKEKLEKNVYTAFGQKDEDIQAHHVNGYTEPKLDDKGLPIFDEDIRNLYIQRGDEHKRENNLPDMETIIKQLREYGDLVDYDKDRNEFVEKTSPEDVGKVQILQVTFDKKGNIKKRGVEKSVNPEDISSDLWDEIARVAPDLAGLRPASDPESDTEKK